MKCIFKILLIFIICKLKYISNNFFQLKEESAKNINEILIKIKNYPSSSIEEELIKYLNPQLSIIIPVYNSDKYLSNLYKSIQLQTLKSLEIIFIDDASKDNSLKLMMEWKKKDVRIKIIKNEINRGILYSRMYGAFIAKGEYITFIDSDDIYCNDNILLDSYRVAKKKKIDLLEFDFLGGRYDGGDKFDTYVLESLQDKTKLNTLYYQPEIKNFYLHENLDIGKNIISGIIYNKVYSKNLISKMIKFIGEDIWNRHLIYMEDFIINLAAAREANSFYIVPLMGVWHWYENKDGMTNGVFDMNGFDLKNPEDTKKKLGDYLYVYEKSFDLTENDPNAENLRINMMTVFTETERIHIYARTPHFERILALCRRMIYWKYSTKKGITFSKKFGRDIIKYYIEFNKRYPQIY